MIKKRIEEAMSYIFLSIIFLFTNCKKENIKVSNSQQSSVKVNNYKKPDTIAININNDYDLEIIGPSQKEIFNFFQPIKSQLINESSYAQILYNKKNIVINIEVGNNANQYEDIYLSKTYPIILEKIIRTTIDKKDHPEKLECQEIINEKLSKKTRYRKINDDKKKCRAEKIN